MPIHCCADLPNCRAPQPGKAKSTRHPSEGQQRGCQGPSKAHCKGPPDPAPESTAHDATDPQSCRGQCHICPRTPSGKAPGHSHKGINPLDSILFGRGPSRPRRPEGGEQDVTGIQLSLSPCPPLPAPFYYFFLSLCLLLLSKMSFFFFFINI